MSSSRHDAAGLVVPSLVGLVSLLVVVELALALGLTRFVPPEATRIAVTAFGVVVVAAGVAVAAAREPRYALLAIPALPVVLLYVVTGLLLPWSQLSFVVGQSALEFLLALPAVGAPLATALFGGYSLSQQSLELAFDYHYAVVGLFTLTALVLAGTSDRVRRSVAGTREQ